MLTPSQSRAARAWLEWSQENLSKRASVSLSTIRDFEKGKRTPIKNNLEAIYRAFEGEGVTFVNDVDGKAKGITVECRIE